MIGKPEECMRFLFNQDREKLFEVKEHKEKRSLNANAYFHVLVNKIAKATHQSAIEVKNDMIRDYGFYDYLPNGEINLTIKSKDFDYRKSETEHLEPFPNNEITDKKGRVFLAYIVKRGSHTYNTQEMAHLIDGTVYEAKELNIETLPEAELQRIKEMWKK